MEERKNRKDRRRHRKMDGKKNRKFDSIKTKIKIDMKGAKEKKWKKNKL